MDRYLKISRYYRPLIIVIFLFVFLQANAQTLSIPDTGEVNNLFRKGKDLHYSNPDSAIYYYHAVISDFQEVNPNLNYDNISGNEKAYLKTVIEAISHTGNIYYYDDQYQRAETYYEQSLQIAKNAELTAYIAKALFDIGYIRYVNNNYGEAKTLFQKSFKRYSGTGDQKGMYNTVNACGLAEYHLGNYPQADSCFRQALSIAVLLNDSTWISDIKIHLGILYCEQENPEEGMKLFKEAMDYYEKTGNTEAMSDAMLNIGVVLKIAGENKKALDYISKSTKIEELGQVKSQLVTRYYNLADLYLKMNNKEKAYEYCRKTIVVAEEIASKPFIADCNFLMGKYFMLEKNYPEAANRFASALKTSEKENNKSLVTNIYLWYAKALLQIDRTGQAEQFARKAYENSRELNMLSIRRDASLLMYQCYEKTGNIKKALRWFIKYHNASDSINFFKQQKEIKRIEARYNYEKKEKENELLRNEASLQEIRLKNRTITMIVMTMAVLLSVVVIILLINRMKYAKALNREQRLLSLHQLEDLNKELEGKERELASKMMFLNQKNELIGRIIDQLKEMQNAPDIPSKEITALVNELRTDSPQSNWKEFETQFVQVHPGFYKRLYEKHPQLTSYEQRIAAFLRMNLNTKEIAAISGRSPKSIEVTRSRIRKKLGLSRKDNLNSFLASI